MYLNYSDWEWRQTLKRRLTPGHSMLRLLGDEEKSAKVTEKEQPLKMEESEEKMMFWKPSGEHVINYTTSKSREMKAEKQPLELVTWRILVVLIGAVWEENENYWKEREVTYNFHSLLSFYSGPRLHPFHLQVTSDKTHLLLWAFMWRWGSWDNVISQSPSSSHNSVDPDTAIYEYKSRQCLFLLSDFCTKPKGQGWNNYVTISRGPRFFETKKLILCSNKNG